MGPGKSGQELSQETSVTHAGTGQLHSRRPGRQHMWNVESWEKAPREPDWQGTCSQTFQNGSM